MTVSHCSVPTLVLKHVTCHSPPTVISPSPHMSVQSVWMNHACVIFFEEQLLSAVKVDASVSLFLLWCRNYEKKKKKRRVANWKYTLRFHSPLCVHNERGLFIRLLVPFFLLSPFYQLTATGSSCRTFSLSFRWGKLRHKNWNSGLKGWRFGPLYIYSHGSHTVQTLKGRMYLG